MVEVKEFTYPGKLENVPSNVMALDLEMANSFRSEPSVICMVGLETYSEELEETVAQIGWITDREDEEALVVWLLETMEALEEKVDDPKFITFSGSHNDIPWLKERMQRFNIPQEKKGVFQRFGHIDLKTEFYKRTQNDNISLKRLEDIFDITRLSEVSSRKVSFILTDLVKKEAEGKQIPERLFQYLGEDVRNLLLIYNRWEETPLETHNLSDLEYSSLSESLIRTTSKFIASPKMQIKFAPEIENLKPYLDQLQIAQENAVSAKSFEKHTLPPFPQVDIRHGEFDRIKKKHRFLESIEVSDPQTGAYRLRERFFNPKGALVVVRKGKSVLMIRRAEGLERAGGFWGLPGGVVENGETPTECALRELKEELGLEGEVRKVLGSAPSYTGEYELIWVEVEVEDTEKLSPRAEEVAEARWVEPQELSELDPLIPGAVKGFEAFLGKEWRG